MNEIHEVDAGLDTLFVSPVCSLVPYGRTYTWYVVHWDVVRLIMV